MAEKITIFELDIDVEGSKRDVEDLRLSVNELNKGLKELTAAEKENNKQLDEQQKKLQKLQSSKKQDIKAISETQANIDKLLTKRTELNKSIVDQTSVLKTNQSSLRENQKVIQNSIALSDGYNKELEETKIKQQLLTAERKKAIREGIKQGNETRELVALQKKERLSEAELIRLNNLLVKKRKNMVITTKAERKEYNKLTVAIAANNKQLIKSDANIGRFQRSVGKYSNALRGLSGALGITGGFVMITQLLKSSTEAYKDQVIVVQKLSTILTERTNATEAEIQSVLDLTTAQQQLGIIGDEIQIAGAQQISTFVTQTKSVETLIPALNNLLAQQKGVNATQQDAVNIGNLIGKVLQGETTALKRVGITFDATQEKILKYGNESERAAALADVITSNVGNMNAELAATDVGQLKNVSNNLGDISEELGAELLPAISEVARIVLQSIKGWKLLIGAAREYFGLNNKINLTNRVSKNTIDGFKYQNEFLREEIKLRNFNLSLKITEKKLSKEQNELKSGNIKFSSKEGKEIRKNIDYLKEQIKQYRDLEKTGFLKGQKQRPKEIEDITISLENQNKKERENLKIKKARQKAIEEAAKAEQKQLDDLLQKQIDNAQKEKDYINKRNEEAKQRKATLAEEEKQRAITDEENRLELLEGNILGDIEAERGRLELKKAQEIEFAESIGANILLINDKYSKANIELNRTEQEAKLALAAGFFGNIATIAGEGTAIGKAAAVAQTVISTYMSATGAYASMVTPPVAGPLSVPLGIAAAGASIAAGFANVKKILAVKSGLPGGGGSGGSVPSAPSTPSASSAITSPIAPEIGKGIISRSLPVSSGDSSVTQTAVIVDEVTAKQTEQTTNTNTSII